MKKKVFIINRDKLKELILDRYLSVGKFAKELGVSQQTIYRWVNGVHTPSLKTVYRIARKLNVEPSELLRKEI